MIQDGRVKHNLILEVNQSIVRGFCRTYIRFVFTNLGKKKYSSYSKAPKNKEMSLSNLQSLAGKLWYFFGEPDLAACSGISLAI
jgi:hypothetical protein